MGEKTAIIAAIAASAIVLLAATPAAAQSARQSGNVFDEQGNPIAGAEVKFDRVKASSSRDHQITKTDAKGSFVITGIRGGSWNVTITAPGYEVYQSTVQVSSFSKNLALNIKLKKLDPSAVGGGAREEAEALVAQADSLIEEGKFNEAIALYQDYLAKNPQLVTINLMIGKAFEKMMDYDSAIAGPRVEPRRLQRSSPHRHRPYPQDGIWRGGEILRPPGGDQGRRPQHHVHAGRDNARWGPDDEGHRVLLQGCGAQPRLRSSATHATGNSAGRMQLCTSRNSSSSRPTARRHSSSAPTWNSARQN